MRTLPLILLSIVLLLAGCSSAEPTAPTEAPPSTEATSTEAPPPPESRLRITAVGDVMCHKLQYQSAYQNGTYDFNASFDLIRESFADTDLLIGNLETTFSGAAKTYSEYPTFNTPDAFADALNTLGFDILTTANNHSLDRRFFGLSRTLDILDGLGILHTGSYRNPEDPRILYETKNGITTAVMAYTYGTNGIALDKGKEYSLNLIDEARIRADIAEAHASGADLILVSLHFGQEYQQAPNDTQKALAALCFEEGADIVLGSHPHVVQRYELKPVTDRYGITKNRFVAYSLGNFISAQRTAPRDAGLTVHLDILKKEGRTEVTAAEPLPTWVDQTSGAGRKMFRVMPIADALADPDAMGLINDKDLFKLERSRKYVEEALGQQ